MFDLERKIIISELNGLFSDFNYLLELAEFCNNDRSEMIKMISKIIKYSFCGTVTKSLWHLNDPVIIDEKYKKYLMANKKRISIFRKQADLEFVYPLDEDIRVSDLQGLNLPPISYIVDACHVNLENKKERRYRESKERSRYKEKTHFEDTALWYSTTGLLRFNCYFQYYHSNLTGHLD